ncbi:hypothetical protein KAI19_01675 [bacterium]|nr:hypothetical protein [bacterium]
MVKRLPVNQKGEELVSLKFEKMRTKIEGKYQNKLREKQTELSAKNSLDGGYGQSQLRDIQVEKVRKLAEGLLAIDIEVYGDPASEKDVDIIIERVRQLVDAHIKSLISNVKNNTIIPAGFKQACHEQLMVEGIGIISNIKRDLLIVVKERKRESAFNFFKAICWILSFLLFVVLLLDIQDIVSITPERLALIGGIVALIIIPFAKRLKILGMEFERLIKDMSDKTE